MRILTLSNSPLDDASGSGYVVTRFASGLRSRGHEVDLLGPPDFEPFFGSARGIRYRQSVGMAAAAVARVARGAYDVVELYGGEGWLAACTLTRVPRRRFIVVAHSNGLEPHAARILDRARAAGWLPDDRRWYQADLSGAFALGFRAVDALVTVSAFDREFAVAERYARGRILAVENPLANEYLGLAISGEGERERSIGFVGGWRPSKGTRLIAQDLPGVLREFPAWRLKLVGVGERFRAAEHFPADVLPQVEVVPFADRVALLRSLYSRLAIAILPSLYESFGLAGAEAMACGAALVASNVGFAHALSPGVEAIVLKEPVSPALAEGLRRLIADAALRGSLARAGHARVQALRWSSALDSVESAYREWLSRHRAGLARGGAA